MANFEPTRSFPTPPAATEPEESRSTATGQRTVSHQLGAPAPPLLVKLNDSSTANRSKSTRYEIRRPLGSGAFGLVNLAWDHQLQREVAIKAPRPGLPESARQSFLQEAQLVARLRHPSVVVVHDVQVNEAGDPFIVYEYLPGKNLRQKLQSGQSLPLDDALSLALAIAEGLAAAHKLGLTHRDLKPANILLDADGRPRIADFGLAIEEGRQSGLKGEIAGTNKYMAPEQVRGDAHHLDGRADLWALGVILYEMLTGRHPFLAEKGDDVLDQILHRPPRPPRQWNPAIPKAVEELVLHLLEKSQSSRMSSAAEVVEAIRRSRKPTSVPSVVGLVPVSIAAVGVIGAAIFVALVGGNWRDEKNPHEPSRQPSPFSAPYSDLEFTPENWHKLLSPSREWGEILFPRGATRSWSTNGQEHFLDVPAMALLEIGKTSRLRTSGYTLSLRFKPEKLNGDCGLFIGYSPSPATPDLDQATLLGVELGDPGRIALYPRRFELRQNSNQLPANLQHLKPTLETAAIEADGEVTLEVEVVDNRLKHVILNEHKIIESNAELASLSCQGKFGVFAFGSKLSVSDCRIRVHRSGD